MELELTRSILARSAGHNFCLPGRRIPYTELAADHTSSQAILPDAEVHQKRVEDPPSQDREDWKREI